jgi:hypothetical protein
MTIAVRILKALHSFYSQLKIRKKERLECFLFLIYFFLITQSCNFDIDVK